MSHARLLNAAGDRVCDQFLVPLAPGPPEIDLWDRLSGLGVAVGIDPGECPDTAGGGPGSRALAIRHRDALAALD